MNKQIKRSNERCYRVNKESCSIGKMTANQTRNGQSYLKWKSSWKTGNLHLNIKKKLQEYSKHMQSILEDFGNPFLEQSNPLLTTNTKNVMDSNVLSSIYTAKELGTRRYEFYMSERISSNAKAITNIILRDKLP